MVNPASGKRWRLFYQYGYTTLLNNVISETKYKKPLAPEPEDSRMDTYEMLQVAGATVAQ